MSKILVVDDIKSELDLIASYLTDAGHTVEKACNGKEALVKIGQSKPDAIITDWMMPQMGGIDICRKLKKNPDTSAIPIIACTAKTRDVDRMWAMKQGVSRYLVKPCSRDEIIAALTDAMN